MSSVNSNENARFVWIFARPLQFATIFGSQFVSHGKYPFCHWGILVTSLDFIAAQKFLTEIETREAECEDTILGDMWELFRGEDNTNTIDVTRAFKLSNVKEEWSVFSAEPLGTTMMTDEEIQNEGKT